MGIELHINRQRMIAVPGMSLFGAAQALGIKVPTSCHQNGKCRECLVADLCPSRELFIGGSAGKS